MQDARDCWLNACRRDTRSSCGMRFRRYEARSPASTLRSPVRARRARQRAAWTPWRRFPEVTGQEVRAPPRAAMASMVSMVHFSEVTNAHVRVRALARVCMRVRARVRAREGVWTKKSTMLTMLTIL